MHKYELAVLRALSRDEVLNLDELTHNAKIGKDEVLWAIQNLLEKRLIEAKREGEEIITLTDEGKRYAKDKLPEELLLERLSKSPVKLSELRDKEEQIGLQWCRKKDYAKIADGSLVITEKGKKALKEGLEEAKILHFISQGDMQYEGIKKMGEEVSDLRKRGLVEVEKKDQIKEIRITEAGERVLRLEHEEAGAIDMLDKSIIKNRSWQGKRFKSYNVTAPVEQAISGRPNILRSIISEVKQAYLSLGFREISGPVIESSLWNFDSLFMPQDHPARDVQDTFYLSNPKKLDIPSEEAKRIKKAHEKGWHSKWDVEVAREAVLRTHDTSVSARYIRTVVNEIQSNKQVFPLPVKLFTVGKVFRNEAIDYTHLADLYQTDGIIIGKNLTLANLFDTLLRIYAYLGLKVRFKPSYFPFVEPGAEMIAVLENGKELEMGGAGIMRKEVVGISRKSVNVLAWGLGVERLALAMGKVDSITQLYNNSVGELRSRTIL